MTMITLDKRVARFDKLRRALGYGWAIQVKFAWKFVPVKHMVVDDWVSLDVGRVVAKDGRVGVKVDSTFAGDKESTEEHGYVHWLSDDERDCVILPPENGENRDPLRQLDDTLRRYDDKFSAKGPDEPTLPDPVGLFQQAEEAGRRIVELQWSYVLTPSLDKGVHVRCQKWSSAAMASDCIDIDRPTIASAMVEACRLVEEKEQGS